MKLHSMIVLALALALMPALAAAQKITYDFDKTAPFATYHKYSWKQGTPTNNALIDNRLIAAIEEQLAAKGMTKDDNDPDVFVLFHMAFDQQKDISSYSTGPMYGGYGYGWGGGWGATSTNVRVREILVGTLAVDLIDAKKKEVVWRGLGTKEIDTNAKPEKRDSNIKKAVAKIFKNYPPRVKK